MKKILHSGQFIDYDGNIIKITFYQEKHLWVSKKYITTPPTGGEIEIEVWSDVGDAWIAGSEINWINNPVFDGSYENADGNTVYKYKIFVHDRPSFGHTQTGTLDVYVEINDDGTLEGYDMEQMKETITITRF